MENELCRVCSGRGEFDIFSRIPKFLHENVNEQEDLQWKKSISQLIVELTGLKISKNDGLPQKICEICISYLKHASIFREQAVNNTLSLITALNMNVDKLCDKPLQLEIFVENRCPKDINEAYQQNNSAVVMTNEKMISTKSQKFVKDKKWFGMSVVNNLNNYKKRVNVKSQLNDLENKTLVLPPIAKFEEINFQEDDILADLQQNDVIGIVGYDEMYRERKCRYCRRRFMFRETYNEHVNECLEKKLINFIYEISYVLELKTNRTITANQFIQKMISALKSNLEIVLKYCDDLKFPDVIPVMDGTDEADSIRNAINTRLNKVLNICKAGEITSTYERSNSSSNSSTPFHNTLSPFSPYPKMCCNICAIEFDDLTTFEKHNIDQHYLPQSRSRSSTTDPLSNVKLIELFEDQDGMVDVEDNIEKE